eukprot:6201254-Pleurochrysis_carterae.AAC.3
MSEGASSKVSEDSSAQRAAEGVSLTDADAESTFNLDVTAAAATLAAAAAASASLAAAQASPDRESVLLQPIVEEADEALFEPGESAGEDDFEGMKAELQQCEQACAKKVLVLQASLLAYVI